MKLSSSQPKLAQLLMLTVLKVCHSTYCSEVRSTDLLVLLYSNTKCVYSDVKNILQAVVALQLGEQNTLTVH